VIEEAKPPLVCIVMSC